MTRTSGYQGRTMALTGLCLLLSLSALSGCGSSSTSSTTSGGVKPAGQGAGIDIAAARALVAPYTGHSGPFPVTQPLTKRPAAGAKYALLQCATPVCAQFAQLFGLASHELGVPLSIVKAGPTVTAQQAALSSIIAMKPAGVIVPGITPDTIQAQLHRLGAMHIPIVSIGVVNALHYGIAFDTVASPKTAVLNGKLMAAWLVLQKRASTNAVFYNTPELAFSPYEQQGFDAEMRTLCPSCQVRDVDLPVADIGNSAPSLVVSDLQAHPSTNATAFATAEAETGLPAALRVAGLHMTVTGYAPPPAVLQYIKAGEITSGLGTDLPTAVFETVDALARLSTHEPLTHGEQQSLDGSAQPLNEFLEPKSIVFNPAMGFAAYPDFAQRFAKLWR